MLYREITLGIYIAGTWKTVSGYQIYPPHIQLGREMVKILLTDVEEKWNYWIKNKTLIETASETAVSVFWWRAFIWIGLSPLWVYVGFQWGGFAGNVCLRMPTTTKDLSSGELSLLGRLDCQQPNGSPVTVIIVVVHFKGCSVFFVFFPTGTHQRGKQTPCDVCKRAERSRWMAVVSHC